MVGGPSLATVPGSHADVPSKLEDMEMVDTSVEAANQALPYANGE